MQTVRLWLEVESRKKSWLHGCEVEEGFAVCMLMPYLEEHLVMFIRNLRKYWVILATASGILRL